MRKLLAFLMAVCMAVTFLSFAACNNGKEDKLICGITDFEPMNYKDASGKWVGFDTEFAEMVAEKLGKTIEFQEIVWAQKYQELESGAIDAIWNGFTANSTDVNNDGATVPRSSLVDFSYSYMLNQQCVVVRKDSASDYAVVEDLYGKTIVAESGSAGESTAIEAAGGDAVVMGVPAQVDAFIEVKAGAADCAVVDVLLARNLIGTGDYSDLVISGIEMESEIYAVGFRVGDELRDNVNEAIRELYNEGKLTDLARKYKLENVFTVDFNFKG